jgi:hypothetical protein
MSLASLMIDNRQLCFEVFRAVFGCPTDGMVATRWLAVRLVMIIFPTKLAPLSWDVVMSVNRNSTLYTLSTNSQCLCVGCSHLANLLSVSYLVLT